jgi:hypothetical protein
MHKPSGRAVVSLNSQDFYLGRYGTPDSQAEYDRLVAEWLQNGRHIPSKDSGHGSDTSVNEMLFAFVEWAESYYRKGGQVPRLRRTPSVEPNKDGTGRARSIDVGRAVLGHSSTEITEIYAERDEAMAAQAMERIG